MLMPILTNRNKIEDLELGQLQPGDVKEIEKEILFKLLKLNENEEL